MHNPFKFIKDVIDILKGGGPGEALGAMEITEENRQQIINDLGPDSTKYVKTGDYVVEFVNDLITVVPRKEFQKHYAFIGHSNPMPNVMNVVRTIKPL